MDNISALKRQAERLLAKVEGSRYVIGDLNKRLQLAAEEHPCDTVIQAVARVIEQISNNNPNQLISQAEFQKIFNELIGLNVTGTRFRDVLGDLLYIEKPVSAKTNMNFIQSVRDDPNNGTVEYNIDSEVKNGFNQLFRSISDKYDPHNASIAKEKVGLELHSLGFDNSRIRLAGGNSRYLIFTADLDSNRGAVRIFVPMESSGNKLPSTFVAGNKFETLTATNIKNYITSASYYNNRMPTVSSILGTLDILTGYNNKTVEQNDFIRISSKLPDINGDESSSIPSTFISLSDKSKIRKDVEIPLTPIPESLKVIASDIEESVLEASVGYPQAAVRLAKRMVLTELNSMGFKNSQIRVATSTQDGFICDVILNSPSGKVSIEVPIEMQNNIPLVPSVFAKDDYIADFTVANLQAFISKIGNNCNYVDTSSQLYAMSLSELKDIIVKSVANNNFDVCNEVMEIISERVDENIYRGIVTDYLSILSNIGTAQESLKRAYEDNNQFVKTPNSIYPIHKKLGLPAHKLIRDRNGEYHKLTYFAHNEQEREGAFFSTAKVLVGD